MIQLYGQMPEINTRFSVHLVIKRFMLIPVTLFGPVLFPVTAFDY